MLLWFCCGACVPVIAAVTDGCCVIAVTDVNAVVAMMSTGSYCADVCGARTIPQDSGTIHL